MMKYFNDAGTALLGGLAGLFVISAVSAVVGYVLASVIWDNWIRLRWRRKISRARDKRLEASTSDTVIAPHASRSHIPLGNIMTRPTQHPRLLATAALGALLFAAVPAIAKEKAATTEAAAKPAAKPEIGDFGFDATGMDKSVQPGDDFYAYANGAWAKKTLIPDDKSNYGMFTALAD
eukprot:gene15078-19264_t